MSAPSDPDRPASADDAEVRRRLTEALDDRAAAVRSGDAWPSIAARLDRSPSRWARRGGSRLAAAVLVLAGLLGVLGLLAALGLGGGGGDEAVETGTPSPTETTDGDPGAGPDVRPEPGEGELGERRAGPVIAARDDGSIVELDPATGDSRREILTGSGPADGAGPSAGSAEPGQSLLAELAVAPGGDIAYQSRPARDVPDDCADGDLLLASDVWRIDLADGDAAPMLGVDPTTPSRLPAPGPDGVHLAYVSTSNGERCDGALVVVVAEAASGDPMVTHTLPVATDVVGLVWLAPERLIVQLRSLDDLADRSSRSPDGGLGPTPYGPDGDRQAPLNGGSSRLTPYGSRAMPPAGSAVELDPWTGGPVDMAGTLDPPGPPDHPGLRASRMAAGLDGTVVLAGLVTSPSPPDGSPPVTTRDARRLATVIVWEVPGPREPPTATDGHWQLSVLAAPVEITSLATDAAGTVWVTVVEGRAPDGGQPGPDGTDGRRAWRLSAGGEGSPTEVAGTEEVGFVAVAATPHMMGG